MWGSHSLTSRSPPETPFVHLRFVYGSDSSVSLIKDYSIYHFSMLIKYLHFEIP
jgi:hypothetical protein